jgi:hypothetical protein
MKEKKERGMQTGGLRDKEKEWRKEKREGSAN